MAKPPLWITFDCYGTLIDWESGILAALAPVLERHGAPGSEVDILRRYARLESAAESGRYRSYREVLRAVVDGFGRELGFDPRAAERDAIADAVGRWRPFPDTVPALRKLAARCRLAVISNVDDAMFAETARLLEVRFDEVITAEQVASYKPAERHFRVALDRLGAAPGEILHAAQSLHHDIAPARALGIPTVHVQRASRCPGAGATPPADVTADRAVGDLAGLAESLGV